ncbi:phosphatase PAP2 family protein [Helcococcus kunzii]|uniref:phosphatase PAP2 family protein n=1 Tax=Helcococcus kunzii TaxID=40091 RepID=UPI0021A70486|nr:phosphatase PAP2 family protein [Helcococcus kunzii]MCT1796451.1 phosphatase PAP2 family protein [Helcococcus kunzii]MCT1989288.1 phosphatase PAP2 family protein [Helcococcus kunzii]
MPTIINKFDFAILKFIQENFKSTFMDKLMVFFTSIGDMAVVWIAISIIFLLIKKRRNTGIKIILGLIVVAILGNLIFKNIFSRLRPFWVDETIKVIITKPVGYSFPSGHTFSSFVAATIIFFDNKKLGYLSFLLATLISFSRAYLFVHFPTDIFVGMLLGVLLGVIINKLYDRYVLKLNG